MTTGREFATAWSRKSKGHFDSSEYERQLKGKRW